MLSAHSARPHLVLVVVLLLTVATLAVPAGVQPAQAAGVPNPCNLPGVQTVCQLPGEIIGATAGVVQDAVMQGVTTWVVNGATWLLGKVGEAIQATTTPRVESGWFTGEYKVMAGLAALLALPMLVLAVLQGIVRQDWWLLARSALGYLPLAFVLTAVAVATVQMLLQITDGLSEAVGATLGTDAHGFMQSVADTFASLGKSSGVPGADAAVPLFGLFLGGLVIAAGAFFLWLELLVREALVYVAVFFLPLAFISMIWPATSRFARRLVEILVAVILSKFFIVAIVSLAAKALGSSVEGGSFNALVGGSALILLAAFAPFALLRVIPMAEAAVATSTHRSGSGVGTAATVWHSSPALQMRRTMNAQWYGSSGGQAPQLAAAGAGGPTVVAAGSTGVKSAVGAAREGTERTVDFAAGGPGSATAARESGGRSGDATEPAATAATAATSPVAPTTTPSVAPVEPDAATRRHTDGGGARGGPSDG